MPETSPCSILEMQAWATSRASASPAWVIPRRPAISARWSVMLSAPVRRAAASCTPQPATSANRIRQIFDNVLSVAKPFAAANAGAKVGASRHRSQAASSAIERLSSQLDATCSRIGRCLAASRSWFGSRTSPVRIPPRSAAAGVEVLRLIDKPMDSRLTTRKPNPNPMVWPRRIVCPGHTIRASASFRQVRGDTSRSGRS
jgi:hypothetical protein